MFRKGELIQVYLENILYFSQFLIVIRLLEITLEIKKYFH